jgi:hypothetical protein
MTSLAKVVPEGFRVSSVGESLKIVRVGHPNSVLLETDVMIAYAAGNRKRLSRSLESNMGDLQDFIAEWTTFPWPGVSVMPKPKVVIENGLISISFVDEDETILELESI